MSDLALKLILKEKVEKTGVLDLGGCGLEKLPDELLELDWIEELNLGNQSNITRDVYELCKLDPPLYKKVSQWNVSRSLRNNFEKANLDRLATLKNLKFLDLHNTNLLNFDFVYELPLLTILNLSENSGLRSEMLFREDMSSINKLNLKVLDLGYIEYACDEWDWDLINKETIEFLNIRGTRFISWNELGISEFTGLRALNADHHFSNITGLEELGNLKTLEFLDLSYIDEGHKEFSNDFDFLGSLQKLKYLDLTGVTIKSFAFFKYLQNLETLYLNRLSLSEVPPEIGRLKNLKKLSLGENKIKDCSNLKDLTAIVDIDLSYNALTDVSPLSKLNTLEDLRLSKNAISSSGVIKEIILLPNLKALFLDENPIDDIPVTYLGNDFLFNSLESLRSYFRSLSVGIVFKNEIKLILTGNSTSGKTSLRNFFKGEPVSTSQDTTHGIICDTWKLTKEDFEDFKDAKDIDVHIWDFGGQEFYHATHRLFFTSRSLYILIWEKQTNKHEVIETEIYEIDEKGNPQKNTRPLEHFPFEYWLETIRQYDEEKERSPIFLVQNKIDLPDSKAYIDSKNIEKTYANLEFFEISVLKASLNNKKYLPGFGQFKSSLFEKLYGVAQNKKIGKGLAELRDQIEKAKNDNTWTYEKYISRIKTIEPGISDNDIALFTIYLRNEAGVILYYEKNEKLKDIVFINPVWVIDCIYNVLDYHVYKQNGIFNSEHVRQKNKAGLDTEKLIELMKSFELIFEDIETGEMIAPQFLPEECQDKKSISPYLQKFRGLPSSFTIFFPAFFPRSIMLRFLSRFGNEVAGQLYWKNGIAFSKGDKMIYMTCSNRDRQIKMYVEDNDPKLQGIFFKAIYELSDKNNKIGVSVNDEPDFISIGDLENEKILGNSHIKSQQGNNMEMQKYEHLISAMTNAQPREIIIFTSYAREDNKHTKTFIETYLKGVGSNYANNLIILSDKELHPGMQWDNKIKKYLESASICIFLISPDFIASNYIKDVEIALALQRFKEKKQIIIPVLLRPCPLKLLPFTDKQYLPNSPKGLKAITRWTDKDEAWSNVAEGIINVIDDINAGKFNDYFD